LFDLGCSNRHYYCQENCKRASSAADAYCIRISQTQFAEEARKELEADGAELYLIRADAQKTTLLRQVDAIVCVEPYNEVQLKSEKVL